MAARSSRAERAAARAAASRAGSAELGSTAPDDSTCWICHEHGASPLLRECACRGADAGWVHLGCLVSAAKHNPKSWFECRICKQDYYGRTMLGLAKALWDEMRSLNPNASERLFAANYLADALSSAGDYSAALPLFEEVLAVRRRSIGSSKMLTLISCHNLADCLCAMENFARALPLAEEALSGKLKLRGEEDPGTMATRSLLSVVHYGLKNYQAALPLARETLERERLTLPPRHPDLLTSINNLAVRAPAPHFLFLPFFLVRPALRVLLLVLVVLLLVLVVLLGRPLGLLFDPLPCALFCLCTRVTLARPGR